MRVFYSGSVVRGREVGSMDLYGKALAPQQLYQRVGRLEQVAGIQPFVFDDGPARGVSALRFRTGGGLSLDVLCDRGMDLGAAEYRGVPLAWLSPTGVVAPQFRELQGEGWLRSFGGGLLVTCRLQNVGEPSVRNGEELGLHGRISNTPATVLARGPVGWGELPPPSARRGAREQGVRSRPGPEAHCLGPRWGGVCVDRGHRAQRGPCTGTSDALVPHQPRLAPPGRDRSPRGSRRPWGATGAAGRRGPEGAQALG